jgi:hypothetical protein
VYTHVCVCEEVLTWQLEVKLYVSSVQYVCVCVE